MKYGVMWYTSYCRIVRLRASPGRRRDGHYNIFFVFAGSDLAYGSKYGEMKKNK
jgi:hypothetical protein